MLTLFAVRKFPHALHLESTIFTCELHLPTRFHDLRCSASARPCPLEVQIHWQSHFWQAIIRNWSAKWRKGRICWKSLMRTMLSWKVRTHSLFYYYLIASLCNSHTQGTRCLSVQMISWIFSRSVWGIACMFDMSRHYRRLDLFWSYACCIRRREWHAWLGIRIDRIKPSWMSGKDVQRIGWHAGADSISYSKHGHWRVQSKASLNFVLSLIKLKRHARFSAR